MKHYETAKRLGMFTFNWIAIVSSPLWGAVVFPLLIINEMFFDKNTYSRRRGKAWATGKCILMGDPPRENN